MGSNVLPRDFFLPMSVLSFNPFHPLLTLWLQHQTLLKTLDSVCKHVICSVCVLYSPVGREKKIERKREKKKEETHKSMKHFRISGGKICFRLKSSLGKSVCGCSKKCTFCWFKNKTENHHQKKKKKVAQRCKACFGSNYYYYQLKRNTFFSHRLIATNRQVQHIEGSCLRPTKKNHPAKFFHEVMGQRAKLRKIIGLNFYKKILNMYIYRHRNVYTLLK